MTGDADCVEHVWVIAELRLSLNGRQILEECPRCGTTRQQPPQHADQWRGLRAGLQSPSASPDGP